MPGLHVIYIGLYTQTILSNVEYQYYNLNITDFYCIRIERRRRRKKSSAIMENS